MADKSLFYSWSWKLQSTSDELWPLLGNSHHFDGMTGMPATLLTKHKDRKSSLVAGGDVDRENSSIKWTKNKSLSSQICYSSGPLENFSSTITFDSDGSKGSILTYQIKITARNVTAFLIIPYLLGVKTYKQLTETFHNADRLIQRRQTHVTQKLSHIPRYKAKQIQDAKLFLQDSSFKKRWITSLLKILAYENDHVLSTLRPYTYATLWGAPRQRIFDFFLSAVTCNILQYKWQLYCDACCKWKRTFTSLTEFPGPQKCPNCEKEITASINKNLEMIFQPHPELRKIKEELKTFHSPMTSPNVLIHEILEPEEQKKHSITFSPGHYSIRSDDPNMNYQAFFIIKKNAVKESFTIETTKKGIQVHRQKLEENGPNLIFSNHRKSPQSLFIEKTASETDKVSIADAQLSSYFRMEFPQEAPPAGVPLQVPDISFIHCQLVKSTELCIESGDESAYQEVRELYLFQKSIINQHNGATAKVTNDSIIGVFPTPVMAVNAAIAIQNDLIAFNAAQTSRTDLGVKIVVHRGPCLAVSFNGLLDYFGGTPSFLHEVQSNNHEEGIVITDSVNQEPGIGEVLESSIYKVHYCSDHQGNEGNEKPPIYRLITAASEKEEPNHTTPFKEAETPEVFIPKEEAHQES
jgi:adenylate cyclase